VSVLIVPAEPSRHYTRIAELLTACGPEPVAAIDLEETDRPRPGKLVRRWVALDGDELVGTASVVRYPSEPLGLFNLELAVEPAERRRGTGALLAAEIDTVVREHGATVLRVEVRDDEPASVAYAERRRFRVVRRSIRLELDLTRLDERRWAEAVDRALRAGVRLSSFADGEPSAQRLRSLYAINRVASIDDPASDRTFPAFGTWRSVVVESAGFQPEGQFLAAVDGRFVGLAAVTVADDGTAASDIAGVEPAFRRRGIATALKVLTLRHARAAGARRIETENDSRNEGMLAINQALGYRPIGGYAVLERPLAV
jgi:GNAT superfamily N-acetyltransferase